MSATTLLNRLRGTTAGRLVLLTGTATFGAVMLLPGTASASSPGEVNTSGLPLNIRSGPGRDHPVVGVLADGTKIRINCQVRGGKVSGRYGTTTLWNHVSGKGYVSDAYVYTGSDGQVARTCGSSVSATDASFPSPGKRCSAAGIDNPRSCTQAVTWARNHLTSRYHDDYYRMCDHVVGLAYGYGASGFFSAKVHWDRTPDRYRHPGDRRPPAGGLVFFRTGSGFGHAAIAVGDGRIASTDIHGKGTFTLSSISEIERDWGADYLGWTNPWFGR